MIIPCRPPSCKFKQRTSNTHQKISPTQATLNAHHNRTHARAHCLFCTVHGFVMTAFVCNTIAHTATNNERETTNVQSAPTKPDPYHQQHAERTPVRNRSSFSINVPRRPSSSRVGRHRARSSQENQTRIKNSVQHKPCQTRTMIQSMHEITVSFAHVRCFHDACICSSMLRRNTIAHTTISNKRETSNLHPAPRHQIHITKSMPKHSSSSFVIVRGRPSSFSFVHHHPVSAVIVEVQAKQIKRESENQSNTSRVKRRPRLCHMLDVFMMPASFCHCDAATPLHTPLEATNTKESTYALHPRNQIDTTTSTPQVRHRSSLSVVVHHRSVLSTIIPCRPSSCKFKPRTPNMTQKISATQAFESSNPCTRPLSLLHCSWFHDAFFCSLVSRRNTIAHAGTNNKHDTINLRATPMKPNPHHQEHAKAPPVN